MSYDRAEIERLRALRANAASSNIAAHLYLMEKDVVWARLDDCLDEIDRLASAEYEAEVVQQLRVAVDVLLTKIDRLTQRVERADVQVRNPPARFIPVPEYEGEETIQKQPWWRRLKTWRTGWS